MVMELKLRLFDLVMSLSRALDLVSKVVANHHLRVAYYASCMAQELGLTTEGEGRLIMAGMLHDIGAFSLQERLDAMNFEIEDPHRHAEVGYWFLSVFEPFSEVANIVRFHHVPWMRGRGEEHRGYPVPLESHILHLADRLEVLVDKEREVLGQVKEVCSRIEEAAGEKFVPELVEVLKGLACRESFWLDGAGPFVDDILRERMDLVKVDLDMEGLLDLSCLFSQIIDFRSRFTFTHSSGVAAVAETLARLGAFSDRECKEMRIAGHLHDLGKLVIPSEILEKPRKLTPEEFNIVRSHAYFTYRVLSTIEGLGMITEWASFHHEHLDGSGYPFHLREGDLSLGSRILAVADAYTALAEDRPYRKGTEARETCRILEEMARDSLYDSRVVSFLKAHLDEVEEARMEAQRQAARGYREFIKEVGRG